MNFALTQSLVEATRLGDDAETGPCPFPEIPGQGSVEQPGGTGFDWSRSGYAGKSLPLPTSYGTKRVSTS